MGRLVSGHSSSRRAHSSDALGPLIGHTRAALLGDLALARTTTELTDPGAKVGHRSQIVPLSGRQPVDADQEEVVVQLLVDLRRGEQHVFP